MMYLIPLLYATMLKDANLDEDPKFLLCLSVPNNMTT